LEGVSFSGSDAGSPASGASLANGVNKGRFADFKMAEGWAHRLAASLMAAAGSSSTRRGEASVDGAGSSGGADAPAAGISPKSARKFSPTNSTVTGVFELMGFISSQIRSAH
jgi:hypothetical protein